MESEKTIQEKTVQKTETSNDEVVSILFISDGSGSMSSLGDEPVQSTRAFYKKQQDTGKNFMSTHIVFNNSVKFIHKNKNGSEINIRDEDFIPNGMTALYDAIGKGIDYQKTIKTKNVICVILTDGLENASNTYKLNDIKSLITEMETEHKWVFIYLGANQDAFEVGNSMGLAPHSSTNYEYTPRGLNNIMREVSDSISRCVSNDVKVKNFVPELSNIKPDNEIARPNNPYMTPPSSLSRTYSC
jgi:hypothetical protein